MSVEIPLYDFDSMQFSSEKAAQALSGDAHVLVAAFVFDETPQGIDWWEDRLVTGIDQEARSVLAFMLWQSAQFDAGIVAA